MSKFRPYQTAIFISPVVHESLKKTVEDLNKYVKKFGSPYISELEKKDKIHINTSPKSRKKTINSDTKKTKNLTIKMFVEGAVNYFMKHKIDPRFYDESESLTHQFIRFRNQNFAFLQTMESEFILPKIEELSNLLKTILPQEASPKMEELRRLVKNIESLSIENYATIEATLTTIVDLQEFESLEDKERIVDKITEKLNRRSEEVSELLRGKS